MTDQQIDPLPPLVVEVEVATDVDRAFATWVERATLWWPRGHTMGGSLDAVVFEPRVGGRIYERDATGIEHTWGEVLVWEPPVRLECLWHLAFPREEATRLAITFTATGDATSVRLEQTGWDALGEPGRVRRERTVAAWTEVTGCFRQYVNTSINSNEVDP